MTEHCQAPPDRKWHDGGFGAKSRGADSLELLRLETSSAIANGATESFCCRAARLAPWSYTASSPRAPSQLARQRASACRAARPTGWKCIVSSPRAASLMAAARELQLERTSRDRESPRHWCHLARYTQQLLTIRAQPGPYLHLRTRHRPLRHMRSEALDQNSSAIGSRAEPNKRLVRQGRQLRVS